MMTKEDARTLVLAELERMQRTGAPSSPQDLIIVDEHTIERSWGWVFFYNSRVYLETRDVRYAIAGNAPLIVNRLTGEVKVTGTARPTADYILDYERSLLQR
jgi:hypothetical protein